MALGVVPGAAAEEEVPAGGRRSAAGLPAEVAGAVAELLVVAPVEGGPVGAGGAAGGQVPGGAASANAGLGVRS